MAQALRRDEAWTAATRDDRVVDLVRLSRTTLGDRSLEREVLQLFVRQSALLIDQLANADAARAGLLAHTLKGSARGVGAVRVAAAAEALEAAVQDAPRAVGPALAQLRAAVEEAAATVESLLAAE